MCRIAAMLALVLGPAALWAQDGRPFPRVAKIQHRPISSPENLAKFDLLILAQERQTTQPEVLRKIRELNSKIPIQATIPE